MSERHLVALHKREESAVSCKSNIKEARSLKAAVGLPIRRYGEGVDGLGASTGITQVHLSVITTNSSREDSSALEVDLQRHQSSVAQARHRLHRPADRAGCLQRHGQDRVCIQGSVGTTPKAREPSRRVLRSESRKSRLARRSLASALAMQNGPNRHQRGGRTAGR